VSLFGELEICLSDLKRAASVSSLACSLEEMTRLLGFDYFGLAHHTDLSDKRSGIVAIGNYPTSWVSQLVERRLFVDDPVHLASQATARSFRWSELPDIMSLTEKHRNQLAAASQAGLVEGLTVPINVPGSLPASCTFVRRRLEDFPTESMPHAHYASCFAFEAARRLGAREVVGPPPRLSDRQIDCLVLVAKGKSDAVAAILLGISRETVHEHIEIVKKRLGVATRQQLVARALFDGHISYADVL
jgi:LuxR family transcriptional regulator, quorum-sensing system regulator CciR